MKWLTVFAAFALLHAVGWAGSHWYRLNNPDRVLLVADTSYALKPHFADMQDWIESYEGSGRYREILVATDKAMIGELADIASRQSIFRTAFGRSSVDDLKPYLNLAADQRILLSDGSFEPPAGWRLISFN